MDNSYYELLGVERNASAADIKRGFRRRALELHPDRSNASDANEAFTWLRHVHDVLLHPEKRALYDEHGPSAVEESDDGDAAGAAFWAHSASKVTPEDIAAYEQRYPRSDDEKEDLIEFYSRFGGNVTDVLMYIPFSEDDDLSRFVDEWNSMIASGRIKETKAYRESKKALLSKIEALGKRKVRAPKKGRVTKKSSKGSSDKKDGGESSSRGDLSELAALIRGRASSRQKEFDEWAESLANPKRKKKSRRN